MSDLRIGGLLQSRLRIARRGGFQAGRSSASSGLVALKSQAVDRGVWAVRGREGLT